MPWSSSRLLGISKGLRRLLSLPRATHSHLLPLISNSLPILDEICKRSARFIQSCLSSDSPLVRAVINNGILARSYSVVGRNVMYICRRYGWSTLSFISGQVPLFNNNFMSWYFSGVSRDDLHCVNFTFELLCLREHCYSLTHGMTLNRSEIDSVLAALLCD